MTATKQQTATEGDFAAQVFSMIRTDEQLGPGSCSIFEECSSDDELREEIKGHIQSGFYKTVEGARRHYRKLNLDVALLPFRIAYQRLIGNARKTAFELAVLQALRKRPTPKELQEREERTR